MGNRNYNRYGTAGVSDGRREEEKKRRKKKLSGVSLIGTALVLYLIDTD